MISVQEALARVLALGPPLGSETVPLAQASGRRMIGVAVALRDQPPFAASAMDGYAVASIGVPGQGLSVIGMAAAGRAFAGHVGQGQAVRIFTGAPVPDGATHVILQENVIASGNRIMVKETADTGTNIRAAGQDFRAGDTIGPRLLRPNDLASLAAMGIAAVSVVRRPVVALVATGDELVLPGEAPRADQIFASNIFALQALAADAGALARVLPIARDTEAGLAFVLDLAKGADLVVTIGGASVGDHDLVDRVTAALGMERAFYKIAMRPGKPLMAGRLRGVPMLGLPGNPVSAIVCAHLFLLPLLRALQGDPAPVPVPHRARLAEAVAANGPRAHYMRARLSPGADLPCITPFARQDSALLSVLGQADALLIRPVGDGGRAAGDLVDYLPI